MKFKKGLYIALIVAVALVLATVLLGVLNATVGKGKWSIGWQDYRYENGDAYAVGGGTVRADGIRSLEIDWSKGNVTVLLVEDDRYLSVTEEAEEALAESAELRYFLDGSGKLTVKFRESGYFFAMGMQEKNLTVRIPVAWAEALDSVSVTAGTGSVSLIGIQAGEARIHAASGGVRIESAELDRLTVEAKSGNVRIEGAVSESITLDGRVGTVEWIPAILPEQANFTTERGNVTVEMPQDPSFTLRFESKKGVATSELPMERVGEESVCGDGACRLQVITSAGDLIIKARAAS